MSNIRVNITELKQALDSTPCDQNILLIGNHGIGKSEIITRHFTEKGLRVVPLFLGQMSDSGDLIGLPKLNPDTGKTEFLPAYWFPTDGKPICLLLDEINRARPELLQCCMDLCLNRTLAGKKLPEGSRIISAVNEGDQYQLTDLDPALVSRFNAMVFAPTVQEWLLYAKKENVDSRIISFIEEHPQWLDKDPDTKVNSDTGLDKTPDRRAWKRVSDTIKNVQDLGGIFPKLIASSIGSRAANAFLSSVAIHRIIPGKEILRDFNKHLAEISKYEVHDLTTVIDGIYSHLEIENIQEKDKESTISNLEAFFDWLTKNRKEAAAYFANQYISGTYPSAVGFMARECRVLTMCLVSYVKSIKL